MIYQFFLTLVKTKSSREAFQEFSTLFFHYRAHAENGLAMAELTALLKANNPQDFLYTLKRCCYILINNWETDRNHDSIQQLVEAFALDRNFPAPSSPQQVRLQAWVEIFRTSKDYDELQLYIQKYLKPEGQKQRERHWSDRYTSYRLMAQYANENNPSEQRHAAFILSRQLKDKFKFDLAMYATRSQLVTYQDKPLDNPTHLGENLLRLIKIIVLRRGPFNYTDLANLFVKQTVDCYFSLFKEALLNYLFFALESNSAILNLKAKLTSRVEQLYREYENKKVSKALILRTCKRVIDCLTTESGSLPSALFNCLCIEHTPLLLATFLLKIALICPNARVHLEMRVAQLIEIHQDLPEEDCLWVVNFLEIFRITFAIYADRDVRYDLIKMETENLNPENHCETTFLDSYRLYPQSFYNLTAI